MLVKILIAVGIIAVLAVVVPIGIKSRREEFKKEQIVSDTVNCLNKA